MQQTPDAADLTGQTLETARTALGAVSMQIVETLPPLGDRSPLRGATEGGMLRVLRARRVEGHWELLVAREQTRA